MSEFQNPGARRSHRWIPVAALVLAAALLGCVKARTDSSGDPSGLREASHETYMAYIKAVNAGTEASEDSVPRLYWTGPLRRMNPGRVYVHRANLVLVQRADSVAEEGKYVNLVLSSYLPRNGDDGFTFTPDSANVSGVFDFRRVRTR